MGCTDSANAYALLHCGANGKVSSYSINIKKSTHINSEGFDTDSDAYFDTDHVGEFFADKLLLNPNDGIHSFGDLDGPQVVHQT